MAGVGGADNGFVGVDMDNGLAGVDNTWWRNGKKTRLWEEKWKENKSLMVVIVDFRSAMFPLATKKSNSLILLTRQ